jgi:hypothetical protein
VSCKATAATHQARSPSTWRAHRGRVSSVFKGDRGGPALYVLPKTFGLTAAAFSRFAKVAAACPALPLTTSKRTHRGHDSLLQHVFRSEHVLVLKEAAATRSLELRSRTGHRGQIRGTRWPPPTVGGTCLELAAGDGHRFFTRGGRPCCLAPRWINIQASRKRPVRPGHRLIPRAKLGGRRCRLG